MYEMYITAKTPKKWWFQSPDGKITCPGLNEYKPRELSVIVPNINTNRTEPISAIPPH